MSLIKTGLVSLGVLSSFVSYSLMPLTLQEAQANPRQCQLLKEVSTGKTEITKTIRRRLVQKDNFKTDFVVPAGVTFKTYKAVMTVQNDAKYNVGVNLKYANNSVASALEQKKIPMVRGKKYDLTFTTPTGKQPYQINLYVSGPNNNTYTIGIMACK